MTQDKRWMTCYNEVKDITEEQHGNPSMYYPEEKLMVLFHKRGRKLINTDASQKPRLRIFKELLTLLEQY